MSKPKPMHSVQNLSHPTHSSDQQGQLRPSWWCGRAGPPALFAVLLLHESARAQPERTRSLVSSPRLGRPRPEQGHLTTAG